MRIARVVCGISLFLSLSGSVLASSCQAGPRQAGPGHVWPSVPERENRGAETLNLKISAEQARAVGQRIWKNECAGTVAGLTSWNRGEAFPSLGIGHFIWFPRPGVAPFEESFPGLVTYWQERGLPVPAWLVRSRYCPWKSREKFLADQDSFRLKELRGLLAATVDIQCDYIARRLARALPKMLDTLPEASQRQAVRERFVALFQTGEGLYALMDYVNFKGEGVKESERYAGQGWGMLQVLEGMEGRPQGLAAVRAFAGAAERVLERRVANAPAPRRSDEQRWLPVWKNRVRGYLPVSASR